MIEPEDRSSPDLPVPNDEDGSTVLEVLSTLKKERDRQRQLRDEADYRERVVYGEQWRSTDKVAERIFSEGFESVQPIQENLLYPRVLTWASRVDQGRVDARAFPFQPTRQDILAARASNMVLDYERHRQNEATLIGKAGVYVQIHGDVLFYPIWLENDGPFKVMGQKVDEIGPVYDESGAPLMEEQTEYGGLREEVIAARDYWTSGEEDYTKASWLVVSRLIDEKIAKRRLRGAGFPDADPKKTSTDTTSGVSREGVETFEVWIRPGDWMPTGLFALVIGDVVVKAVPFPYDHGELPGAVWKCGDLPGSPRGKTHVSDAIHQQRLVNAALGSILMRTKVAQYCRGHGPSSVLSQYNANPIGFVQLDGEHAKDRVFYVEGPDIPKGLFDVYERARRALNDTFGMSDATVTGGDPNESTSGKQMRIAEQLDAQKLGPSRRLLEAARCRVRRQWLALWQQHATKARLVRVIGPDGAISSEFFRGADLQGADIVLEPSSGLLATRQAAQREAEELGAGGFIPPAEALERRTTGLPGPAGNTDPLARVDAQARAALEGKAQQPLPDVDPKAAIARLKDHTAQAAIAPGGMAGARALFALIDAYEEAAKMRAQMAAQQQPGQPEPGGKPQPMKGPQMQKPGGALRPTPTMKAAAQLPSEGQA